MGSVQTQWYLEKLIHAWQQYEQPGHNPDLVQEFDVAVGIKQAWGKFGDQKPPVRAEDAVQT